MPVLRGAVSSRGISPEHISQPGIIGDATIGFDDDGRILSASTSAVAALGYTRAEDLAGQALTALIDPDIASGLLVRIRSASDLGSARFPVDSAPQNRVAMIFLRKDGTRISVNTVVAPKAPGGSITLLDPTVNAASNATPASPPHSANIATTLRMLADQTAPAGGEREICSRFAAALRSAAGTEAVLVARSTGTTGLYETVAHSTEPGAEPFSDAIDLPPALIPQRGAGPVSVESLEGVALFDPVIIGGEAASGAFLAARAEYLDGITSW